MKSSKIICLAITFGIISSWLQGINPAMANLPAEAAAEEAHLRDQIRLQVVDQMDQQLSDPATNQEICAKIVVNLRTTGIPATTNNITSELHKLRTKTIINRTNKAMRELMQTRMNNIGRRFNIQ